MVQSILLEGLITEPDDWWFPSQGEFDCLAELATATDATNVVAAMSSDRPWNLVTVGSWWAGPVPAQATTALQ